MKLYNHCGIPNDLLLPILKFAQKFADCKGNIIVKVGPTIPGMAKGWAPKAHWVDRKFLRGKINSSWSDSCLPFGISLRIKEGNRVNVGEKEKGYVVLYLTSQRWFCFKSTLDKVRDFFKSAIHEFAHVADYQNNLPFSKGHGGKWENRPEEKRACFMANQGVKDAAGVKEVEDAIMAAALWIQGNGKLITYYAGRTGMIINLNSKMNRAT